MEKVLYKYNPQQMTKEELFETFVGRKALFESLITRLKKERDKPHHQHILLKAPRGMGKTHLLSMVYFKVKDCPEISSFWIPVQFAEEEFGITDLKTFFARILEELSREDSSLAKDFPKDDYTTSYAFLIDYLKRKNKNVLILVDNFNLILSRFKTIEVRRLRDILMNDPYLLIYGGAISLFKEIRDEKEPFYRFFKIEEITELKEDEFERLLYLRFRLDGKDDVLNKFPQAILSSRLKALYQLTGGNPRLLLILYQFIIPGELKDIITYLKSILDEQSQYFLEKIHRLSPQQQVIIDAIAKDSLILSPKEISQKTGLLINTVTAQISRLMDDGYLTPIKFTRTKNLTGYELSEQIFRVWYQMRTGGRSEQRIQFLIIFLQIWFTKEELKTEIIRTERMASLPEREEKITYLKEALEGLARIDEKYTEKIDEVWEKIDAREFTSCLEILDEIMQDVRVSLETTASIWFSKGYIFVEMKDYTQAISCYQEAI
ncbi:MAG: winged helix-turn-helix transcriptional regulator, partial [bacterium]